MELNRLRYLLLAQWGWLVLAGLAGLLGALLLTSYVNDRQPSRFEAVAPVILLPEPGSIVEDRLQDGRNLAQQANEGELAEGETEITIDPVADQLLFIAMANSQEEAKERAELMRDRFLQAASPVTGDELVAQTLEVLQAQVEAVGAQLSALASEGSVDAERQFLIAQITALGQRVGELALELALLERDTQADSERREEIETELGSIRAMLVDLQEDLAALPDEADPFSQETLTRMTLERHYAELVDRYQTLYLESADLDPSLVAGEVVVADVTSQPIPKRVAGLVGLLAGLLFGLVFLIARDRMNQPIWSGYDLGDAPILAELPPRWPNRSDDQLWYPRAPSSPRKSGIQVLRAVVEGVHSADTSVVALTGVDTDSPQVQALAADLAVSLAVAGRTIILIDADLGNPATLQEYNSPGLSLTDVLLAVVPEEEGLGLVKRAIHDRPDRFFNLRVIPAGPGIIDVADALAVRRLSQLLTEARSAADLVIVAGPDAVHPGTDSLSQRVDEIVVVTQAGRTMVPVLDSFKKDLGTRRAHLLGTVFLKGLPEGRLPFFQRLSASWRHGDGTKVTSDKRPHVDVGGRHKRPVSSAEDHGLFFFRQKMKRGRVGKR